MHGRDDNPPPPPPPAAETAPPKPKESRKRQVSFAPLATMSVAPSAHPQHKSGHISYHRLPQVTWNSGTGTGTGYVRVTGGSSTINWHNYDANIPVSDFLAANQHQQGAILGAMNLAQNGGSRRTRGYPTSGRIVDVSDNKSQRNGERHNSVPVKGLEQMPPPPKRAPSPTSVSKAATKISHHSNSSHGSKDSKKSNRSNKTLPVLKCVSCGQEKKPDIDNVKPIKAMADMPLCWKCVVEHLGSIGGETWFSGAWAIN